MQINKKYLFLGLLLLAVIIVTSWYFTRPQGAVEFGLAPQEMQLKLGTKEQAVKNDQKITLTPGSYEATFSREGFTSSKKTIQVYNGQSIRTLVALNPETEEAKRLIANSEVSQKILKEIKEAKYNALIKSLPLAGVNYSLEACPSVKHINTDKKALCLLSSTPAGEAAATAVLEQKGFNLDDLEILIGSGTSKTIIKSPAFKIDFYTNVEQADPNKATLFITPLNVPYVPYSTQNNPQLEAIRTQALDTLKNKGYNLAHYDIYYSNIYLSRYNAAAKDSDDGHAMPPVTR